jgi:hypothetical protein
MYAMLRGKVDQHTKLVDLYREVLEEWQIKNLQLMKN